MDQRHFRTALLSIITVSSFIVCRPFGVALIFQCAPLHCQLLPTTRQAFLRPRLTRLPHLVRLLSQLVQLLRYPRHPITNKLHSDFEFM